jgi:hypothetical protein
MSLMPPPDHTVNDAAKAVPTFHRPISASFSDWKRATLLNALMGTRLLVVTDVFSYHAPPMPCAQY